MPSTNNFPAQTPRKIHLGAFQPDLEAALAAEIAGHKQARGPLTPLTVVVPTYVLGLQLRRHLAPHANIHFQTLDDLMRPARVPSRLGLELLCRQLARDFPADGYFAPVRDTAGFAAALLETFKDLEQAGLDKLTGPTKKLRELGTAYAAYRRWLTEHDFLPSPLSSIPSPVFLYGFYDLTTLQKQFVQRLAPAAVFFPFVEQAAFADPLLTWFKSLGYAPVVSRSTLHAPRSTVVSAPGEAAEVREAVRAILDFLRDHPGATFTDVAILCRSREQYDTLLRDTLPTLGVRAFFRGGRPLVEHPDARLFLLMLETIRSDFSRSAVMELACHLGPNSHWDALTVELGIVGGQEQWQHRLHGDSSLAQFIRDLLAATTAVPRQGSWEKFVATVTAAFRQLGGRHAPILAAVETLVELDAVKSPVSFETFAEFCRKALDAAREQPEKFQGGGVFVSDVMGARGLSFAFVALLGLVEKSFPRVIREDPLLLDSERANLSRDLPRKRAGYDEERLLFGLATGCARDRLVLSFPRLDAATARPRVPSYLLLDQTGAADFKALDKVIGAGRIPLTPVRDVERPLDSREFDLLALKGGAGPDYLAAVAPLVGQGLEAAGQRWRERGLTAFDGWLRDKEAVALVRERFGLDKLVIGATSLEDFFFCPFYYFQKHILGLEAWEEPEAALAINALDLGSLYHVILETFYRGRPAGKLDAVMEEKFREFEQQGVTGFPAVWEIKKEIVREELRAFVARDRAQAAGWTPAKFEEEFQDLIVAPPVRLRGKIDRIDLSADGRRGRVLDYKTGKVPPGQRDDSLARGEALQLPLYLLAAERLLPGVTVEEAAYLYFTLRGGFRSIRFTRAALTDQQPALQKLLALAAGMIRAGVFAQYATKDGCRACEFRPICGNGILKLYERKQDDERMAAYRAIKEVAT